MSVVIYSISLLSNACVPRVATPIMQFWTEVDTLYVPWSVYMVSKVSCWLMKWINLKELCNPLSRDTVQTRCSNDEALWRINVLVGAMYMIDTWTEYFPMVAMFMPFVDALNIRFAIGSPLRALNTLSVGGNILTMRSKKRIKRVCGWSILTGAM